MSPEANEGKPDLEESQSRLEEFLTDAEVGTPEFMAFSDWADFMESTEFRGREFEEKRRSLSNPELAGERIDVRSSEIPKYASFQNEVIVLMKNVKDGFMEDGFMKEGETRTVAGINYLEYINGLREDKLLNSATPK